MLGRLSTQFKPYFGWSIPSGRVTFSATTDAYQATSTSAHLQTLLKKFQHKYGHLKNKPVLLLYSGGVDTSFLTRVLSNEVGAKVYTVSFNLGEDPRDTAAIRARALSLGATEHFSLNEQEIFANHYIAQAIKANAFYHGAHPLSSSLSRPLMVEKSIALCKKLGCVAFIHGSSAFQNNAPRFNNALKALASDIEPITPVLEMTIERELEVEYLKRHGIEIRAQEDKLCSQDFNFWSPEAEDGSLQQINAVPPDSIYQLTKQPKIVPKPCYVDIEFEQGVPIRLQTHQKTKKTPSSLPQQLPGEKQSLIDIITQLNKLGGALQIGRWDALEGRAPNPVLKRKGLLESKEREVHEGPAPAILIPAHKDLEGAVTLDPLMRKKEHADIDWVYRVYRGNWFGKTKTKLDKIINQVNERVTGTVRVLLRPHSAQVVGRASSNALDTKTLKQPC